MTVDQYKIELLDRYWQGILSGCEVNRLYPPNYLTEYIVKDEYSMENGKLVDINTGYQISQQEYEKYPAYFSNRTA